MTAILFFGVVAIPSGQVGAVPTAAQQSECKPWFEPFVGTRQSLFGIKLRPKAVELLKEIETRSGNYLREYLCPDDQRVGISYEHCMRRYVKGRKLGEYWYKLAERVSGEAMALDSDSD